MKSLFSFICCSALLAGSAYREGRFTKEVGADAELLKQASEQVLRFPMVIGDWTGKDILGEDEDAMRRGGGARYVSRTYQSKGSPETLSVLLMCGKPGPLSVHTPEVCYAGASFSPDPDQRKWKPTEESEFTWQTFTSRTEGSPNLEIAWAWSLDGRWQCPSVPRLTFGRQPYLYKLYVVRTCFRESSPSPLMNQLLAEFVPKLRQTVFAKNESKTLSPHESAHKANPDPPLKKP